MKAAWEAKRLGEVCSFQRGLTYTKEDEAEVSNIIVLRANNIHLEAHTLDLSELRFLRSDFRVDRRTIVQPGSLIICMASGSRSHLGKVALIEQNLGYAFGGFMGQITPRPGLCSRYLYHWMTSAGYRRKLAFLSGGTNINNLRFGQLAELCLPVPPLTEQRRIVEVLDAAFAGLAVAVTNAEQALANALSISQAGLENAYRNNPNPVEWKPLGDLVIRLTNGYVGPIKSVYVGTGVPYLLARHVRDNAVAFDGRTFVTQKFNRANSKSILKAGDVLLVQSGHIGHSAVVPLDHDGHNCHAMIVITPNASLYGAYLSMYMNSSKGRKASANIRSGSTVPHLTCKEVRKLSIPLPSVEDQHNLVEMNTELQAACYAVASIQRQKLTLLAELKQSLLHRAFAGELV